MCEKEAWDCHDPECTTHFLIEAEVSEFTDAWGIPTLRIFTAERSVQIRRGPGSTVSISHLEVGGNGPVTRKWDAARVDWEFYAP